MSLDHLLNALDATDRGRLAPVTVTIGGRKPIALPVEVAIGLYDLARLTQAGAGFAVMPLRRDLTTTQAATAIGVSRRALMQMISNGDLPAYKAGTHFRLRLVDVTDYRRRLDRQAAEAATAARLDLAASQRPTPPASGA